MVFSNGSGWCSGTLIANTSNTFEPYFLTAHHCQLIGNNPDFGLWRFDFDYESANCQNPGVEPVPRSVLGSELISNRAETDFMLLKINPIPLNYDVYFNGWNRDDNLTTVAANSVYIHHRISTFPLRARFTSTHCEAESPTHFVSRHTTNGEHTHTLLFY